MNKHIKWRARLYVDGSCLGNGRPNSEMAIGVVAYLWPEGMSWDEANERSAEGVVCEPWPLEEGQALGAGTNNRAEVLAVQHGLLLLPELETTGVVVLTDSEYTKTMLESSKYPKANADIITATRKLIKRCGYCYINWVRGHDRSEGNCRADQLATAAATAAAARRTHEKKATPRQRPLAKHGR
jgi:ribonuclease HI